MDKSGITAFLMGGWGTEAAVSRATGKACMQAAVAAGWECMAIELDRNVANRLSDAKPARVFNALHGQFGEDGNIQGLLNTMGIPYTHSGQLASAIAMDKPVCKQVLADTDIIFPPNLCLRIKGGGVQIQHPPPYVIKPRNDGSSVGVIIVAADDKRASKPFPLSHWAEGTELMAEPYIAGRELTVAVLDGKPLTVTEIRQANAFYDYEAKYATGGSTHHLPAKIDGKIFDQAMAWAATAHTSLGCRGVSRADYRYDEASGQLYMLEINTQPGMTATSLLPEQARLQGIEMPQLITTLLEAAQCD